MLKPVQMRVQPAWENRRYGAASHPGGLVASLQLGVEAIGDLRGWSRPPTDGMRTTTETHYAQTRILQASGCSWVAFQLPSPGRILGPWCQTSVVACEMDLTIGKSQAARPRTRIDDPHVLPACSAVVRCGLDGLIFLIGLVGRSHSRAVFDMVRVVTFDLNRG